MPNVIYDAGALIAAERGRRAFLAMHRESLAAEIDPIVPDVVLAQMWRGSAGQAVLSQVLAGCDVAATGERTARAAGVACGRAGTSDVVDAVVMVTAVRLAAHPARPVTVARRLFTVGLDGQESLINRRYQALVMCPLPEVAFPERQSVLAFK